MFPRIPRRWTMTYALSVIVFILLGLYILFSEPPRVQKKVPDVAGVEDQVKPSQTVPSGADQVTVVEVVDGDTIKVTDHSGNNPQTIRFIGIDTPELHDPRKPVECFAEEAQQWLEQRLLNKQIYVLPDATQSDADKYNRQLRYLWLADGTFINKYLIEEGYAFEYTYKVPYVFQGEFKQAQAQAERSSKGLWNTQTCNGKHVPASSNK